jgi:hypothetical protein
MGTVGCGFKGRSGAAGRHPLPGGLRAVVEWLSRDSVATVRVRCGAARNSPAIVSCG